MEILRNDEITRSLIVVCSINKRRERFMRLCRDVHGVPVFFIFIFYKDVPREIPTRSKEEFISRVNTESSRFGGWKISIYASR